MSHHYVTKAVPTNFNLFVTDPGVILEPKVSQNCPQNDTQIDPNGTPGRSRVSLGKPWDPIDVPVSLWAQFWCLK